MVKPKKKSRRRLGARTYKNYSQEMLDLAIEYVKSNQMTTRDAERQFRIPRRTLINKIKDNHTKNVGCPTRLTEEEENNLVKVLVAAADFGCPLTKLDLRIIVKEYLARNGRERVFKGELPGKTWVDFFLERHSEELSVRICQNIKTGRAQKGVQEFLDYFNNLEQTIKDVPPSNILNLDETNLSDDPGSSKCIFRRGVKYPERVLNSSKGAISLMFSASANGGNLPPYVVYKAEGLNSEWITGGPRGAIYNRTKSGWFDTTTFEDYFKRIVIPWADGLPGKKVVICDNLSSHLNVNIVKLCKEHDISFVFIPPSSTHLTQPLDVAFFAPLKKAWRSILLQYKIENPNQTSLNKNHFPKLLSKLIDSIQLQEAKNIKSGFKAAGIVPLSANAIMKRIPEYAEEIGKYTVDNALLDYLKKIREPKPITNKRNKKVVVEPGKSVSEEDFIRICEKERIEAEAKKRQKQTDKKKISKKTQKLSKKKKTGKDLEITNAESDLEILSQSALEELQKENEASNVDLFYSLLDCDTITENNSISYETPNNDDEYDLHKTEEEISRQSRDCNAEDTQEYLDEKTGLIQPLSVAAKKPVINTYAKAIILNPSPKNTVNSVEALESKETNNIKPKIISHTIVSTSTQNNLVCSFDEIQDSNNNAESKVQTTESVLDIKKVQTTECVLDRKTGIIQNLPGFKVNTEMPENIMNEGLSIFNIRTLDNESEDLNTVSNDMTKKIRKSPLNREDYEDKQQNAASAERKSTETSKLKKKKYQNENTDYLEKCDSNVKKQTESVLTPKLEKKNTNKKKLTKPTKRKQKVNKKTPVKRICKREASETSDSDVKMSEHSDSDICDIESDKEFEPDFDIVQQKPKKQKTNTIRKTDIIKQNLSSTFDQAKASTSYDTDSNNVCSNYSTGDTVLLRYFHKTKIDHLVGIVEGKIKKDKMNISLLKKIGRNDNTKFVKTKTQHIEIIDSKNIIKAVNLISINTAETEFVLDDDDDYSFFDY